MVAHSEPTRSQICEARGRICLYRAGASSASYLNVPAIISAAEVTDAEAIHPGYDFFRRTPTSPRGDAKRFRVHRAARPDDPLDAIR